MAKEFTDAVQFLTEAKEAVTALNAAKKEQDDLELAEKQQAKALDAEKKAVENQVNSTVKKRQDDLESSYNKELSKANDALKKAQAKRAKAKQDSMKERIGNEQEPFREENRQLKNQIKSTLKDDSAPAFCGTLLYFSLYFPRAVKEILLVLVLFVIIFIGLPLGLYELIPLEGSIWLVLIYVVVIVVFGGLYLLIGEKTKTHHRQAIQDVQRLRRAMAKNRKKMRKTARGIRREKTEEHYDLAEYDKEVAERQQDKDTVQKKKEEALAYFAGTTKPAITEEIVGGSRDKINAMEAEHKETAEKLQKTAAYVKQNTLSVTDDYESVIGREFMQPDVMDKLIGLIQSGQASSLTDAETLYRQQAGATPNK